MPHQYESSDSNNGPENFQNELSLILNFDQTNSGSDQHN